MSTAYAVPQFTPQTYVGGWHAFGGDPSPLSGDSPLEREANALAAEYRRRQDYLTEARDAPENARQHIISIHERYLAELDRCARAGEPRTEADKIKVLRDSVEAEAKSADFDAVVEAAAGALEDARQQWIAFMEKHWRTLLEGKRADSRKVVAEYAKAHEDLENKLTVIRGRWTQHYEDARKIVGNLDGQFTRDDLPPRDDFRTAPTVSAEAIERQNPRPVVAPTPALIELDV